MVHDPAWDMPRVNWQQQGSFEAPEIPPAYEPDAEPLVCLPRINQYWLPYVMGALDQLRNPSSWLVADDDAMSTTLYRVSRLKQMIGSRGDCMSYAVRFDAGTCQLQESTDGGGTWSEVDGWEDFNTCLPPQTLVEFDSGCTLSQSLDGGMTYDEVPGWTDNFSGCVQKYTPIIGLPPNPGDKDPDTLSCAIAAYLAEQVIIAAIGKAVTAISDDLTLLQFGLDVVNIIPEFVLVTLAADAFSAIYVAVQEGTLSDFEDALTDPDLLSAITCAIYGCILADGYVKPTNFDCIAAAIASISYVHPSVVSAISAYLAALGPTGIAQLSQVAGLHSGEDCSSCAGTCMWWDFALGDRGFHTTPGQQPDAHWANVACEAHDPGAWFSQDDVTYGGLDITHTFFTSPMLHSVRVVGGSTGSNPFGPDNRSIIDPFTGDVYPFEFPDGAFDVTVPIGAPFGGGFRLAAYANGGGVCISGIYVIGETEPPAGPDLGPCP